MDQTVSSPPKTNISLYTNVSEQLHSNRKNGIRVTLVTPLVQLHHDLNSVRSETPLKLILKHSRPHEPLAETNVFLRELLAIHVRLCLDLLAGLLLQQNVLVLLLIQRQVRERHAERLRAYVIKLDASHANLVFEH